MPREGQRQAAAITLRVACSGILTESKQQQKNLEAENPRECRYLRQRELPPYSTAGAILASRSDTWQEPWVMGSNIERRGKYYGIGECSIWWFQSWLRVLAWRGRILGSTPTSINYGSRIEYGYSGRKGAFREQRLLNGIERLDLMQQKRRATTDVLVKTDNPGVNRGVITRV